MAASVFALVCRRTVGTKIACAVAYALLAGLGTLAIGSSDLNIREGQGSTRQDALRYAARSAGVGKHVYWLGPDFHGVQPTYVTAGSVSYVRDRGSAESRLEIKTPAANPGRDYGKRSYLRVSLSNGDTVVLSINGQTAADRAALQQARAEIEPIPLDVTASGCN